MAEWISVKDRLPESGKDVLVFAVGKVNAFIEDTTIEITEYTNVSLFPSTVVRMGWRSPYLHFFDNYEITHWMPLPESPMKEE